MSARSAPAGKPAKVADDCNQEPNEDVLEEEDLPLEAPLPYDEPLSP